MKRIYHKHFVYLIASLLLSTAAFAQMGNFDPDRVRLIQQTCPKVSSLAQDPIKKTWRAPGGWYSPNPSFFRELKQFVGAQWVGVNVGSVICSYARKDRADFAVHLKRNSLVRSPNGGSWGKNEGGYKNCHSSDIVQCTFSIIAPATPRDVYEQLDFFKTETSTITP